MNAKRQELQLHKDHPALVLFDVFKGQTTPSIQRLLQENNISFVLIPPNCTDKLQPLDISVNKADEGCTESTVSKSSKPTLT